MIKDILNTSFKALLKKAVPVYLVLSLSILIAASYLARDAQTKLVNTIVFAIEQDIFLGNVAEIVANIHQFVGTEFDGVQLITHDQVIASLPNIEQIEKYKHNYLVQKYPIKIGEKQNNSQIIFYKNQTGFIIKVLVAEVMVSLVFVWLLMLYAKIINKQHQAELIEQSARAMEEVAKQVSHDIRSPLAALNMITKDLNEVPEDRRLIIRNSTQRINDIANTLLSNSQNKSIQKHDHELKLNECTQNNNNDTKSLSVQMKVEYLPAIIDCIISEKRVQYRELQNIKIELNSSHEYNQFVNLNQVEFKRMISNLINNSVEAFQNQTGTIQVILRNREDHSIIEIRDNGKGIPQEIIEKLGTKGFSYDKKNQESGSGLGLYHAKKMIQLHQGQFDIKSQFGQGTMIRISLPLVNAPSWFVEKIEISQSATILCIDDDLSIHQIWKNRFAQMFKDNKNISFVNFTSINEFKNWYQKNIENSQTISESEQLNQSERLNKTDGLSQLTKPIKSMPHQYLYLVDYEFLGQKQNGIELIRELGIASDSILVTSRYDDESIQKLANGSQIKIIPKTMAVDVPITFKLEKLKVDAILIDDDTLCIHPVWRSYAHDNQKNIALFSTYEEFQKKSHLYSFDTPIYIDSSLGNNIKGEIVSQEIFASGFREIFLCTGYEPDHFPSMPWIKKVLGKDPQF